LIALAAFSLAACFDPIDQQQAESPADDDGSNSDSGPEPEPEPTDVEVDVLKGPCALFETGALKCWGANASGRLGLGDTESRGDDADEMGLNLPYVDLGTGRTVSSLAAGDVHVCAILDDGSVKCWGGNAYGQLGLGDTEDRGDQPGEMGDNLPAVELGAGRTASYIAAEGFTSCAILDNDSVKCWGKNTWGQLGQGDTDDRGGNPDEMGDSLPAIQLGTTSPPIQLSMTDGSVCVLFLDLTVKCWGLGQAGALGTGNENHLGDGPNEMGSDLPTLDLNANTNVLASGAGHHCARLQNQTVKCWGGNNRGQLGLGDINHRGDNPGEMGVNLPTVGIGTGRIVTSLSLGWDVSCGLRDDLSTICWGWNMWGQLGQGDVEDRGDEPGELGDVLPPIDLGTGRQARAINMDSTHTCALLDDNSVKCWGRNDAGQLGLGDTNHRGDEPNEMGDNLPAVDLGN
jgi:alpha-tubulin suppressor-like RCC1 family protein